MTGRARRPGGPRRGRAVRRVCALLAATGLAMVVVGCAGPSQGPPPEPVLGHGEQFAVGVFEPRAGRVGAPREGTLVVHEGGCLEYDNPFWPHCDGLIWPHPGVC
ncbi:hypothetical protein [Citricoccus nitrophenolicus]|uniref:hypothetical protein n=1 Tax=Citricoccus nitrophenolicus TaxID=863575 RepID=UPI0031F03BF1